MENNYEKIWEAYLAEQPTPPAAAPEMPVGSEFTKQGASPAAAPGMPARPAAAAEPVKPATPVSMTTIQQAPEVLKALATLFENPTILSLIKKEIAAAGNPEVSSSHPGISPGEQKLAAGELKLPPTS